MSTKPPIAAEVKSVLDAVAATLGVHPKIFLRMALVESERTRKSKSPKSKSPNMGAFILQCAQAHLGRIPGHRRAKARALMFAELEGHLDALDAVMARVRPG